MEYKEADALPSSHCIFVQLRSGCANQTVMQKQHSRHLFFSSVPTGMVCLADPKQQRILWVMVLEGDHAAREPGRILDI